MVGVSKIAQASSKRAITIPVFSWHMAKSPLEVNIATLRDQYNLIISDHKYIPGGSDQIHIRLEGNSKLALSFLREKPVIQAIRKLNLGLMRKGKSIYSAYHCVDLATGLLNGLR